MAKLLYFGRLADITGTNGETQDLPVAISNTDQLREWVNSLHQAGNAFLEASVRIAINNEMVSEPCQVSNGDEIAFLPPVGGG